MKIEVGDFVLYQDKIVQESKKGYPTVRLSMIKVAEITEEHFKDKDDNLYDSFRVKFLFRKGIKEKIEHDGYDEERCIQKDVERLNKGV